MRKRILAGVSCALILAMAGGCGSDTKTVTTTSGQSVYDSSGKRLGKLMFTDWPAVAIEFDNGGQAMFEESSGSYWNGLCSYGECSGVGAAVIDPVFRGASYNFCAYADSSCGGECLVSRDPVRPHSSAIFIGAGPQFLLATTSTLTAYTGSSVLSYYDHFINSCTTPVPNSSTHLLGTKAFWKVTGGKVYTFPSGITYPFTGPLKIE